MPRRFYPVLLVFVHAAFILPLNVFAQQWHAVESGVTSTLQDVMFVNNQVGWVGGNDNILLKTTNGGNTWFQQSASVGGHIVAIWFNDEHTGYIVGGGISKGTAVYKTTDGGDSWEQNSDFGDFQDVQFVSKDTGWVIGYRYKRIWKTTDGGDTWTEKGSGLYGVFKAGSFINGMEGWVAGAWGDFDNFEEEIILHTTDGGESWELKDEPNRTGPLNKIHVLPSGIGFAYGWGVGLKTTNRGETWEAGGPGNVVTALYALDEEHIYVHQGFADERWMYMSSDTGKSWSRMACEDISMARGIFFLNPSFGWAVGADGKIWRFDTTTVGVDPIPPQAESPALSYAYPNPVFRSRTTNLVTITMDDLSFSEHVSCSLYNLIGERVFIMPQIERTSQGVRIQFDTNGLAPGVYYYRIANDAETSVLSSGMIHIIQ